jgi:hypothetical protein
MESNRFDDLARQLASPRSRRTVLALLAGVVAGSVSHSVSAAPRCKQVDQVCKTTADCCPEQNGTYCGGTKKLTCQPCAGTICKGGCTVCPPEELADPTRNCTCVCRPGLTRCNGVCVDLQTDITNCGSCGNNCDDGDGCTTDVCVAGQCANIEIGNCCQSNADCDDGDTCTTNSCVANQCQSAPLLCTGGDVCTGVQCVPGFGCEFFPLCNDGDDCTEDICDAGTGACSYSPLTGNPCIDSGTGQPGTCNNGVCDTQFCPPSQDLCNPVSCDADNGCVCAQIVHTAESFCSGAKPLLCSGDCSHEDPTICESVFGPGARCVVASCCSGGSACAPSC